MEKGFIGENWDLSWCAGRGYMQTSTVSSDHLLRTGHAVTWSVSSVIYSSRVDLSIFP